MRWRSVRFRGPMFLSVMTGHESTDWGSVRGQKMSIPWIGRIEVWRTTRKYAVRPNCHKLVSIIPARNNSISTTFGVYSVADERDAKSDMFSLVCWSTPSWKDQPYYHREIAQVLAASFNVETRTPSFRHPSCVPAHRWQGQRTILGTRTQGDRKPYVRWRWGAAVMAPAFVCRTSKPMTRVMGRVCSVG